MTSAWIQHRGFKEHAAAAAAAVHRMVVPHGENFSLGRSLTVWGSGTDDTSAVNTDSGSSGAASAAASQPRKAMWSPEVAFVYRPNNVMLESCFFYGKGSVQHIH